MGYLEDTDIDRERTTAGNFAIGVLVVGAIFLTISFTTPSWMESDPRIYGSQVEKVGLWVHCFRSLPDYNDLKHQRYFAGCRWLFNPFTAGYDQIRNILAPRKFSYFCYYYFRVFSRKKTKKTEFKKKLDNCCFLT